MVRQHVRSQLIQPALIDRNGDEARIVAFEYGGVGDVFGWRTDGHYLLEQVPRLQKLFQVQP